MLRKGSLWPTWMVNFQNFQNFQHKNDPGLQEEFPCGH